METPKRFGGFAAGHARTWRHRPMAPAEKTTQAMLSPSSTPEQVDRVIVALLDRIATTLEKVAFSVDAIDIQTERAATALEALEAAKKET